MKLISWNVNGLRACVIKDLWMYFGSLTRIFSVYRRASCRRGRFRWICRDIISTGIML